MNQSSSNQSDLVILSERVDPAPGTHTVGYYSDIDDIRDYPYSPQLVPGFATGAVLAAEFMKSRKKAFFSMQDVLGIDSLPPAGGSGERLENQNKLPRGRPRAL